MNQATIADKTTAATPVAKDRSRFGGLEAILIVIAAGVLPAMMFFAVSVFGANMPWMDDFAWLGPIIAVQHGATSFVDVFLQHVSVIGSLWAQHNEHRIFIPSILAVTLSLFGGWSEKREELTGVAIVSFELAMIWRMLRATVHTRALAPTFLAASLILFSLAQYENWTWGFQTCWFIGSGLALLSVFLLTEGTVRWRNLAGALAASIGSAYSVANGLMSPVAGFIILLALRDAPRRSRLVWVVCSFVALALYFHDYRFESTNGGPLQNLTELAQFPTYVLLYLGSLLGSWNGPALAAVYGGVGLLVYTVAMLRFILLRCLQNPYADLYLPWLGLSSFGVLSALLTSLGRVGWGPESALQSRYTSITAVFWVSVVALAVIVVTDVGPRIVSLHSVSRTAVATIAGMVFVFSLWRSELTGYALMVKTHAKMERGMHALANLANASDAELYDIYPPDVNVPRVGIKLMTLSGQGPLASAPNLAFEGRGDEPSFGVINSFSYLNDNNEANVVNPVPQGAPLIVRGWVCDSVTLKAGQSVVALIDKKETPEISTYGLITPDIASGFFDKNLENVGFEIRVDTRSLSSGRHNFEIDLKTRDNRFLHPLDLSQRVFWIAPGKRIYK